MIKLNLQGAKGTAIRPSVTPKVPNQIRLGLAPKPSTSVDDALSDADTSDAPTGSMDWLTQGTSNIRSQLAVLQMKHNASRAPEFYLRSGESKRLRFRSSSPLAMWTAYRLQIDGFWKYFTAPAPGERDLFREQGLRPVSRVCFEVIDLDGFTYTKGDRAGKSVKNVPCFFVMSTKLYEQLMVIAQKRGDLSKFDLEVSKSGKGKNTVYTFLPDPQSPFNFSSIPSIASDLPKYYAPPQVAEQRQLLNSHTPADEDGSV